VPILPTPSRHGRPHDLIIVGTGISGLAPPFLSGKDLASKLYSHLDNHDFAGHAKPKRPASPPPKFYAQHVTAFGMFFDHQTFAADQLMIVA
jgi:hypothetical protein